MKQWLINKLADIMPNSCPFSKYINLGFIKFTTPALCRINPLYEEVIAEKLRRLGY